MNSLRTLLEIFQCFSWDLSRPISFLKIEKLIQKGFRLDRCVFFTVQGKDLIPWSGRESRVPPVEDSALRALVRGKKKWKKPYGSNSPWTEFHPVLVDGKIVAAYGLGATRGKIGNLPVKETELVFALLTERTASYLRALENWNRLEASNRQAALGFLSASWIHEIKNSITPLSALVQMLPDKKEDPGFMESFEKVMGREIQRLTALAENFLDFSRYSSNKNQRVDLGLLAHQVAELLNPVFKSKSIEIKIKVGPEVFLAADEGEMKSLLMNLIQNAFQSVERHGKVAISIRRLSPSSARGRNRIWLEVRDNGPGIREGNIQEVFTPFFSTREEGTGLGLAICGKIVEKHHGVLGVRSHRGKGTVFTVSLPVGK